MNTRKTIAIQADDPEFIAQYEERVKQSGKSVKNYLMDLIKSDFGSREIKTESATDHESPAFISDMALMAELQERLEQTGKTQEEYLSGLIRADVAQAKQALENATVHNPTEVPPSESEVHAVQRDEEIQSQNAAEAPTQEVEESSTQDTAITNLFVKITKEQREALENQKNETGETVGKIINRLIDGFLGTVRGGGHSEEFEETYQYYDGIAGQCNTTCSAKIPSQTNQDLFAYLEETGKSRNVLIASLVHMELHGQDMEQSQEQEQGMAM